MKPYILGAIFARGGSKGLPKKNIRDLAGKPLIAYAIETGKEILSIDRLIVSTDDEEIAKVAKEYGAQVPFMRPKELATDDSPELLSWQQAIKAIEAESKDKVDVLVVIPTTSPLREAEDLQNCLDALLNSDADIVVAVKEAERNPYFNMLTLDKDGYANLPIADKGAFTHRQLAPKVYDMTTIAYVARAAYILETPSVLAGKVKTVIVPRERAIDIDDMMDFEIAEFLMKKRRNSK
ncbi:MAG: acylneuraminate cytidylyltransferase family protein [Candidatus Omnitrophica bacterium]|nr:acylneuraminate cytidylyltransferase family protein [Candidatus Omnitrophota bacterium]